MLRTPDLVVKFVQSVLRLEGSLWWKRFVKDNDVSVFVHAMLMLTAVAV